MRCRIDYSSRKVLFTSGAGLDRKKHSVDCHLLTSPPTLHGVTFAYLALQKSLSSTYSLARLRSPDTQYGADTASAGLRTC